MKFTEQLEAYGIPAFQDKYVDYKKLKNFIDLHRHKAEMRAHSVDYSHGIFKTQKSAPNPLFDERGISTPSGKSFVENAEPIDVLQPDDGPVIFCKLLGDFTDLFQRELEKVVAHFDDQNSLLQSQLSALDAEADQVNNLISVSEDNSQIRKMKEHRERLQHMVLQIWNAYDQLDMFVSLNAIACHKILKKRDKNFKINAYATELKAALHELAMLKMDEDLKKKLLKLSRKTAETVETEKDHEDSGEEEDEDAVQALRFQMIRSMNQIQTPLDNNSISFVLGACSVMLLNLVVLLSLSPTNPYYTLERFLAVFPVFRLLFMLNLFTFGAAAVVNFFERYRINYRFLLFVDPKASLDSHGLASFACLQFFILFVGFGLWLSDLKFSFLGVHNYYFLHPLVQCVVQFLIFLLPISNFEFGLKKSLLFCLFRTSLFGLFLIGQEVTLAKNMLGDVLTSLSKPLADLAYTACFFTSGMNLDDPQSCGIMSIWLPPVLAGFPFWVRMIQCFVRYHAARKESHVLHIGRNYSIHQKMKQFFRPTTIHMLNALKYVLSLSVIIVTYTEIRWYNFFSPYEGTFLWVFLYIVATAYSFYWDVIVDWGLMPDADNFLRPKQKRMLPNSVYGFCTMTDLVGRLSWALTLMPIAIVEVHPVNKAIFVVILASVEITRRAFWAVLRLENEHQTNSSKYRAMLWIPPLLV